MRRVLKKTRAPPFACQNVSMPRVNPEILSWARKTAGFSQSDAVESLASMTLEVSRRWTGLRQSNLHAVDDALKSRALLRFPTRTVRKPQAVVALATIEPSHVRIDTNP
jgi:hypothetical protein